MQSRQRKIIILLAHGSKEPYLKKDVIKLKKKLKKCFPVSPSRYLCLYHAFLQFNKPSLKECLQKITGSKIVILPLFISQGRHTLYDVKRIIKDIKRRHKYLDIKLALPLGPHDLIAELLYKRYKEISHQT